MGQFLKDRFETVPGPDFGLLNKLGIIELGMLEGGDIDQFLRVVHRLVEIRGVKRPKIFEGNRLAWNVEAGIEDIETILIGGIE